MDRTILAAFTFLTLISCSLFWVVWRSGKADVESRPLTILFLIFGSLCGYVFGMLESPLDKTEQLQFSGLEKGIATLITGYLFGKIELVINPILSKPLEMLTIYRLIIFICALLVATLATFITRGYLI